MKSFSFAAIVAMVLLLTAGPVTAQEIPDHIPDDPTESLADREEKRMEERFRGTLSRFFSTGSFDMAPVTTLGLGYQVDVGLGYGLRTGDALHLSVGTRTFPSRDLFDESRTDLTDAVLHVGAGYLIRGTRFFGTSRLGYRTDLGVEARLLFSDVSGLMVDLVPTYAIFAGSGWSMPVGARVSLAAFGVDNITVTRTFVAAHVGVRWQWLRREQLK